jgi:hypothetical protein
MSFVLHSKLFQEACAAKRGDVELSPGQTRFAAWLADRYGARLVYMLLDEIDIGPAAGRPRLWLVVESAEDVAKLERTRWVLKRGVTEAVQHQLVACGVQSSAAQQIVHIVPVDFSREAIRDAVSAFLDADRHALTEELAALGVWRVTGSLGQVVVFYLTQDDIEAKMANGQSDAIARRCYELVRPRDQFGYLTFANFPIVFDSKENLDANYGGSEFYYFR